MRRILLLTLVAGIASLSAGLAQKKPLDHDALESWKEIENERLSPDGRWVTYHLQPGMGDPVFHIYDGDTGADWSYRRGAGGQISADSRYVVFTIKPPVDTLKAMRRRKVKKEDLPGDTLGLYDLRTGQLTRIADLTSFKLPAKWPGWLAYAVQPDSLKNSKNKDKGNPLVLRSLDRGAETIVPGVTRYELAEEGPAILLASTGRDSAFQAGVYLFDGKMGQLRPLLRGKGTYESLLLDKKGERAAFLADLDTTKVRVRPFALYSWRTGAASARPVAITDPAVLPAGWRLSEEGRLRFSEDGARLFFGVAPTPLLPDTTRLDEEVVNVEIWNYTDERLYTQQEIELNQDKKRTYTCVWHINENKMVRLADETTPDVELGNEGKAGFALALNDKPYLLSTSWEGGPACKDVYLVDVKTGREKMIAGGVCGSPHLSPEAKFVYWYSQPDSAWYAYQIDTEKLRRITTNKESVFYDEFNDRPEHPSSYGLAGWTTQDDFVMIYDRYDIWLIDPRGNMPPNNLTKGRKDKRRYRHVRLDPEARAIEEVGRSLFHYFEEPTKREGYVWFNVHTGLEGELLGGDYAYSTRVNKARQADRYLLTRETFQTFPDLLYSTDLRSVKRVSDANPEQQDYFWGSAELVNWTSLTGEKLTGILYKPEGFDAGKQYPMLVYFYERMSDGLHNYTTPRPSRSAINFAFYASRGYLVFVPDIPYRVGYPGESAFHAIVPGVTSLIDRGFVDAQRIGLQGHSWGGYQAAYLITETDLFRCAESGAPVVNMFSAYGGIRWGSGLVRQFQYERTQSRIGGTIWEKPLRYLENSPLFFVDKINTPVLILHNDEDTAVPWEQGIEFFTALRRLGKPSWLLNYNGEPHGIVKWQNKMDFTRRMQQFFDYYLQDAPMPRWMEEGVSPIEKGIEQKFELMGDRN